MPRGGYQIRDPFGTYFVTFTVVGWVDVFTRRTCRDIFIESLRYCQEHKGLMVNAFVLMDSHTHLILRATPESQGLSAIIRDLKKHTSKKLLAWLLGSKKESRRDWLKVVFEYHAKYNSRNQNFQFWQQKNRPMLCEHPKFTRQKLNYLHNNPVVAGIVDRPEDYRYSSARNYLGQEDVVLEVTPIDFGWGDAGYVMVG